MKHDVPGGDEGQEEPRDAPAEHRSEPEEQADPRRGALLAHVLPARACGGRHAGLRGRPVIRRASAPVHSLVCAQLMSRLSRTILKWDTPPSAAVR